LNRATPADGGPAGRAPHAPLLEPTRAAEPARCFDDVDPWRKRAHRNLKWHQYGNSVTPAWIAEHDFPPPGAVREALASTVDRCDFGYHDLEDDVAEAFAAWTARRYGWRPDTGLVDTCVDTLAGVTAAVTALAGPGAGVILTPPIYHVFLRICPSSGRRQLDWRMRRDDRRGWFLHPDDLEELVRREPEAAVLLWCNPHNPTGWVPDRAVQERIVELAHAHDFYVVSDEIHADLVYPPASFTPMLDIPGAAERVVTVTSPAKTFALSGLRCAVTVYGDAALRERVAAAHPPLLLGHASRAGIDAAIAAWTSGDAWADALLVELARRRDQLTLGLAAEEPRALWHPPEATFLAWINVAACGLGPSPAARLLERARVALQEGTEFGAGGDGHVRVNFGTTRAALDDIIDRIVAGLAGPGG